MGGTESGRQRSWAVAGRWVQQVGLGPTGCTCTSAQRVRNRELLRSKRERCWIPSERGEGRGSCWETSVRRGREGGGIPKGERPKSRPGVTASGGTESQLCRDPAVQGSSCGGDPAILKHQLCRDPAVQRSSCARPWLRGTAAGPVSSCLGPRHKPLQLCTAPAALDPNCVRPCIACPSRVPPPRPSPPCTSRLSSVPAAPRCAVVRGLGRWSCTAVQAAARRQDGCCSGLSPASWGPTAPRERLSGPAVVTG